MLLHHIFGSDRNRRRQRRRRRPLPHLYYDNMHTVNHLFWHLDHTDVGDEHSLADGGQLVCKSMSTQSYHGRGSAFRMKEKERKKEKPAGEAGSPNISLIPSDCRAPSLQMSSSAAAAAGSQRARRSSQRMRGPGPPAAAWTCRRGRGTRRDPQCPRRPG